MLEVANGLEFERDLAGDNTLRLPCTASRFWRARSDADVIDGLRQANEQEWPLTVLGGGSNLLLPPRLHGLVLAPDIEGVSFTPQQGDLVEVVAGAAMRWHALVIACVERGLWGIENLALIPGWVGAAPIQNIGAYGVELADVLSWVELVDRRDARCYRLTRDECRLGYRDSIFKGELANQVVITRVCLALSRHPAPRLDYGVLNERVTAPLTPGAVVDAVCAIRREKLPDPRELPNAGSFFKNPVVSRAKAERLAAESPAMPRYPQADDHVKLAAGWLIDQCDLKGWRQGAFGVHHQQALVLVHFGGGSLDELLAFAAGIVERVSTRFGVALEREPRLIDEQALSQHGAVDHRAAKPEPKPGESGGGVASGDAFSLPGSARPER
ncbi:UDP-N-acetylmuramate dehydrogenase [Salinicola aestuarinus]|uniref:UDP-N-acetylmuramate dehydrogenase n=1 Tax=Salinicola aestuarinus TaxID=1949082 RepID=UPI000DA24C08|nr:UDP-N-acetylmuramate dehydrogenase [Salinicola aestuarinus]